MMGDLFTGITSLESIVFEVFSAAIIDSGVRDKILDHQLASEKKQVLLRAVEARIELQPSIYYELVKILAKYCSMEHICQKMREKCGKSQLCITSRYTKHFITYFTDTHVLNVS